MAAAAKQVRLSGWAERSLPFVKKQFPYFFSPSLPLVTVSTQYAGLQHTICWPLQEVTRPQLIIRENLSCIKINMARFTKNIDQRYFLYLEIL